MQDAEFLTTSPKKGAPMALGVQKHCSFAFPSNSSDGSSELIGNALSEQASPMLGEQQ
jgi:hypothetical protein